MRATELRYRKRWSAARRKDRLAQMGVDEIYFGKQMFIAVVNNLDTGELLWFGQDRKQETLDEFFRTQLSATQRKRVEAACVDMWRPFGPKRCEDVNGRVRRQEWSPNRPQKRVPPR